MLRYGRVSSVACPVAKGLSWRSSVGRRRKHPCHAARSPTSRARAGPRASVCLIMFACSDRLVATRRLGSPASRDSGCGLCLPDPRVMALASRIAGWLTSRARVLCRSKRHHIRPLPPWKLVTRACLFRVAALCNSCNHGFGVQEFIRPNEAHVPDRCVASCGTRLGAA
jgi:hypothetical protein